ncbi:MAG: hypothetical protein EBT03_05910 [Betaproteobacteria bacterium]|nr:hypothetical protein [Betaproteobacteria bacterium]NBY14428.1 hypothetical protein [Betaproteobacteria bacterium]NCA16728.1 hypothetical protein [Betaproteobacteria bacterium]
MFDAELWPPMRPKKRVLEQPQDTPLFHVRSKGELEPGLPEKIASGGFQKGIPEKIVHLPLPVVERAIDEVIAGLGQADREGVPRLEGIEIAPAQAQASEATSDTFEAPDAASFEAGLKQGFEQGLEQGRQEGHKAGFADGLEAGKKSGAQAAEEAGFERGLQEGIERAKSDVDPTLRDSILQEGMALGRAQAEASLRAELEAPMKEAADRLKALTDELALAARETKDFHAPLKRLAMHLAEQMVRGELTLSGKAIARLLDRCLLEFGQDVTSPVLAQLNPRDLQQLRELSLTLPKTIELRPDETLTPGSLRVAMNGAVVEDLIEHRHKVLWRALVEDEEAEPPPSFLRSVELVKAAFDDVLEAEPRAGL